MWHWFLVLYKNMDNQNIQKKETLFFFGLFIGIIILNYFLFKPFLSILFLSITFSIFLHPVYRFILEKVTKRPSFSAFLTILLSFIFILTPVIFLGKQAFFQAKDIYISFSQNNVNEVDVLVLTIESIVQRVFPDFSINTASYANSVFSWMTDNFTDIVFGTLTIVIDLILFLMASFFFIRDGRYFVDQLILISPMRDSYDKEIISKVSSTVNSVIKGTLLVSVIQGILVGIGLYIFNVPNAVLWGAISAICAVVPGLGTGLIVIPSVIYLFFIGNTPYAIGLIIWGALLVGMIDNFLNPYIIRSKTKIHSMLILFSVLGGISFFGPEGFIFGPVIVSILVSFVSIYKSSLLNSNKVDFIP